MTRVAVSAYEENARGGYSKAVRLGNILFVSGQVARNEKGDVVGPGDPRAQAEHVFANLRALLERSGSGLDRVGKITMMATSPDYFGALREARSHTFDPVGHHPASTFIVVAALAAPELLVQIDAVALAE